MADLLMFGLIGSGMLTLFVQTQGKPLHYGPEQTTSLNGLPPAHLFPGYQVSPKAVYSIGNKLQQKPRGRKTPKNTLDI